MTNGHLPASCWSQRCTMKDGNSGYYLFQRFSNCGFEIKDVLTIILKNKIRQEKNSWHVARIILHELRSCQVYEFVYWDKNIFFTLVSVYLKSLT